MDTRPGRPLILKTAKTRIHSMASSNLPQQLRRAAKLGELIANAKREIQEITDCQRGYPDGSPNSLCIARVKACAKLDRAKTRLDDFVRNVALGQSGK
jgi:hypothetical protein